MVREFYGKKRKSIFTNFHLSILVLYLLMIASSSKGQTISHIRNATITGNVADSIKYVRLKVSNSNYLDGVKVIDTIVKTYNGSYKLNIYIPHLSFIQVNGMSLNVKAFNRMSKRFFIEGILIEPGDSINVDTRTGDRFQSWDISGIGSVKNDCIKAILLNTNLFSFDIFRNIELKKSTLEDLKVADSIKNMIYTTLSMYKSRISGEAINVIKYLLIPYLVPDVSEIAFNSKSITQQNISKFLLQEIENYKEIVSFEDSAVLYSQLRYERGKGFSLPIRQALLRFFIESNLGFSNNTPSFKIQYYNALREYIPLGPVKEYIIGSYLIKNLYKNGLSIELEKAYIDFKSSKKEMKPIYRIVDKEFNMYYNRLEKGKPAYPFILPDTTGRLIKMSDFKGKVILIDFMFNQCPGCRNLVPLLTDIEKNYSRNPNVVFISISHDSHEDIWKDGIGKSSVAGSIQLHSKSQYHPIYKFYNIRAFPTLVLIGKDGCIISPRVTDPRADSGKTLTNLINKELY